MSINTINRVWKRSKVGRTTLLLLLALADVSSNWGYCYPNLFLLTRKARQDKKVVIQESGKLEWLGEVRRLALEKVESSGRTATYGFYQVASGMTKDHIAFSEKVSPLYQRIVGESKVQEGE